MQLLLLLSVKLLWILCQIDVSNSQTGSAYELPPMPSYVILAPKQIRPKEIYQASITVLKMLYPSLAIRMSIKQVNVEMIQETIIFNTEGTRLLRLEIPTRAGPPDDYYLEVIGSVTPNSAIIFSNRTKLEYIPKEYIALIQMSKPVYRQSQTVQFRVIPLKQNLMAYYGTVTAIQVLDANGFIVKRWLNPTTNVGGIYEFQFLLADQVPVGKWRVEVDLEKWKASKEFEVREFWLPRFDVNISLPVRYSELGFGVYGIISANKTSGMWAKGIANITLQIRDPALDRFSTGPLVQLVRQINYFEGKADFLFTMDELKSAVNQGNLANKDVWVNATVKDTFTNLTRSGWAYSYIYSDATIIKFFGSLARPYKPGMTLTIYIAVYQPDGTPTIQAVNRNVQVYVYCSESTLVQTFQGLVVPDSGIITLKLIPPQDCPTYRLRAEYVEDGTRVINFDEQRLYKYYSQSGAFMQISLATDTPKVNEYAVFNIEMSYPTDRIYYHIVSGGNIVYVDTLIMDTSVTTRTLSLAVSREMSPVSRLVAYYIKTDGEVVSDSLTFFVNLTNLNNVNVMINKGKDLNLDTLEINGYGEPGAYLVVNVLYLDLYRRGADNILRDYNVIDALKQFEKHYEQPYQHDWYHDDLGYVDRTYLPAPSFGADTNSTLNSSGIVIYTDANFTKVNFYHTCNETQDPARAFPCYSRSGAECYSRKQRCDGVPDCVTWVDESNCPVNSVGPNRRNMIEYFDFLYRHWNDGAWLWKTYWIKPNGRINFRVELPKIATSWVVGAFAIDRAKGFSVIERPILFSGVRRFYMVTEAPEDVFYGEQIGVRISLFNYWDYWTEALVEVKKSTEFKVVQIIDYGNISAFSIPTTSDVAMHTLVYLAAGESKFLFIPIIPNGPGNATMRICAYTFIGSNCESLSFRVTMNGVSNRYHTADLIDLTSKSVLSVWNFKFLLRQSFYEPEERMLRWVPDSKLGRVSVVGDIFGPTPSSTTQFVDTYQGLILSHGAAENVFFEFGYNLVLLQYLRLFQSTDISITKHTLDYVNMILQDCLSYFDSNSGGFANFRESRYRANVLATAFALYSLAGDYPSDWDRYIYFPENTISSAVNFISQNQTVDGALRGSFVLDDVVNAMFLPTNISNTLDSIRQEAQRRIPVTAMVVIALSQGKGSVTKTKVVSMAVEFLRANILSTMDIFSQIIGTYALNVGGSSTSGSEISTMVDRIQSNARGIGDTKYFSNTDIYNQPREINNAGQLMIDPRYELPNDAYTTLCSAFATLLLNDLQKWTENDINNINMIKFLAKMRNHMSGFTSTFDSLVAVKALLKFSNTDRNRQWYKLQVVQSLSSKAEWSKTFNIVEGNYSYGSEVVIPNNLCWGEVILQTQGTGRVLLQLDATSRVFDAPRLKNPQDPTNIDLPLRSFSINCRANFTGKNSSIAHYTVCGSWIGTDGVFGKPSAGLTVFDLELPTGYVTLNDELRRYVESGNVPSLRYARFWPGKIHFYLDQLTTTPTCVTFRADRYFPVANVSRDHLCSAYEYYEPGRYNRSIYQTVELYSNHICNVFGTYQCPWAPFFNAAFRSAEISIIVFAVLMVLSLINYYHDNFYDLFLIS